jgi:transposase
MNLTHYIGFDVHKKHINYCSKRANGDVVEEGRLVAERAVLRSWAGGRAYPWHGALEATLFSGWIFDTLKPYAVKLEMAHPAMVKAIAAAKKKNDRIDARMIADCCAATCCPPATWLRRRSASYAAYCAIANWWCASRCACRTRWQDC